MKAVSSLSIGLFSIGNWHRTSIAIILYLILFFIYGIYQPGLYSSWAFATLMAASAPLALAAAGESMVIISGGFDLSLAGVVSLVNVVLAVTALDGPSGAIISLILCIVIGALVGLFNGFFVAYLKIQSIAVTLATMIILSGISLLVLNVPGGHVGTWMSYKLTGILFGLLPSAGLFVLVVLLIWGIFRQQLFGLAMYALGDDEKSAVLSGINGVKSQWLVYIGAGVFYGLAGFMLSAQTATGDPRSGTHMLLLAFAAAVLGGVSLRGGRGGVLGAVFGAAILVILNKVLFAVGIMSFYTEIMQGGIIIAAVAFYSLIERVSGDN